LDLSIWTINSVLLTTFETSLMNRKILLDSNILVYALEQSNPYHQKAEALILNAGFDFFVTTKNISEYFAVCSKLDVPSDKSWSFYESLCLNAEILFPTQTSLGIFETLLKKYQPRGNRVYDIEIVSIALANGISEICTVNVKDFSGVTEITVAPL